MAKYKKLQVIIFYLHCIVSMVYASEKSQQLEQKKDAIKGDGSPRRPRELVRWDAAAYAQGIAFWNVRDRSAKERQLLKKIQDRESQSFDESLDADEKDEETISTSLRLPFPSNKPAPLLRSQGMKNNAWVLESVEDENC